MPALRKIIHIDMDCFYAAIEMRDQPELRNKPVAVGGSPDKRGVLCTCNYSARKFGVRSAMATAYALRLCPELIVVPVNMEKYKKIAQEIRQIFYRYTKLVEPLSLDEAYLDVTECPDFDNSATKIAAAIRAEILAEHQLTASAGIAPNKFLAKVASEWNKPNGQFVIAPKQVDTFVARLPIDKIFGVGKVTAKKLTALNITTCADLQKWSLPDLTTEFGKLGHNLYEYSRGVDHRSVEPAREHKVVSVEHTFVTDLLTVDSCLAQLPALLTLLIARLQKHDRPIKSIFVKLKFSDFKNTTAEQKSTQLSSELLQQLLISAWKRREFPVRLIGIGVHFDFNQVQQPSLL